jgi:hypothetical protein
MEDIVMATHRRARIGLPLALAVLFTGSALAEPPPGSGISRQAQMGYLNGGFGEEQADLMRSMTSQFPVRMTFSRHNGTRGTDEFVADVKLRVTDSAGQTVVDLASQGPIFLLRLPEGAYSVEAEHNGEVKTRRFEIVSGRHHEIAFSWAG